MEEASHEILVRVAPRLLGDVLTVALRQQGLAVHTCPVHERRAAPRTPRDYAVAVVTDSLPADAAAREVILIDREGVPRSDPDDALPGPVELACASAVQAFDQLLAALRAALLRAAG